MNTAFAMLKETFQRWSEDKAPRLAAALAYYTVFSLAPLLIIVLAVVGFFFNQGAARERLMSEIQNRIGPNAADLIGTMIDNTANSGGGVLATVIGVVILLVGATGVFVQLQGALNEIWDVRAEPKSGIMHLLLVRLMSLGMLLVIGFLLLVSFALQTAVSVLGTYFSNLLPGLSLLWQLGTVLVSLAIITVLLAFIYKVLPDVEIRLRDVWVGAAATSVLFVLGQVLIGWYLSRGSVSSTYGAAGSLVVLLLWIYYSAQILLLGAEFTQVYARRFGRDIRPNSNAVAVSE